MGEAKNHDKRVFRRTIRLKITPAQADRYVPTRGINVAFDKWNKEQTEVNVEFSCSSGYMVPDQQKFIEDIDKEIATKFGNVILKENVTPFIPTNGSNRFKYSIKAPVSHPLRTLLPREIQTDIREVQDVIITDEEIKNMNWAITRLAELNSNLKQYKHERIGGAVRNWDGTYKIQTGKLV
jgi:K+-sensing histidine kinase KdpD